MNLKNILLVRNTGNILPKASIIENMFGMKLSSGGGPQPTYYWDFTGSSPLVDKIQGSTATGTNVTFDSDGMHITSENGCFKTPFTIKKNARYVVELGSTNASGINHHGDIAGFGESGGSTIYGVTWLKVSNYWAIYTNIWENMGVGTNTSYFSDSIIEIVADNSGTYFSHISVFKNGELIKKTTGTINLNYKYFFIGSNGYSFKDMIVKSLKIYEPEVIE